MTAALPAEVLDACADDLAELADDLAHSNARSEAFQSFLEDSDDPRRETRFRAPCGCRIFLERVSDDGETSYRAWTDWYEGECKRGT